MMLGTVSSTTFWNTAKNLPPLALIVGFACRIELFVDAHILVTPEQAVPASGRVIERLDSGIDRRPGEKPSTHICHLPATLAV